MCLILIKVRTTRTSFDCISANLFCNSYKPQTLFICLQMPKCINALLGERATEKKQLFCPAKVVLLDYNCGIIFCWQRLRITNAEYHDWQRNIQCGSEGEISSDLDRLSLCDIEKSSFKCFEIGLKMILPTQVHTKRITKTLLGHLPDL